MNRRSFSLARLSLPLVPLAIAALTAVGCNSDAGYKRALDASSSMGALRAHLTSTSTQVDATIEAVKALLHDRAQDPRPLFQQFAREAARLRDVDKSADQVVADMEARGVEYFQRWEEEAETIASSSVRERSAERRKELQGEYARIGQATKRVSESLEPLVTGLDDLRKFLNNDLTPAGLNAAGPQIEDAEDQGAEIRKEIKTALLEIERVSAALAPTPTPPPPPSSK